MAPDDLTIETGLPVGSVFCLLIMWWFLSFWSILAIYVFLGFLFAVAPFFLFETVLSLYGFSYLGLLVSFVSGGVLWTLVDSFASYLLSKLEEMVNIGEADDEEVKPLRDFLNSIKDNQFWVRLTFFCLLVAFFMGFLTKKTIKNSFFLVKLTLIIVISLTALMFVSQALYVNLEAILITIFTVVLGTSYSTYVAFSEGTDFRKSVLAILAMKALNQAYYLGLINSRYHVSSGKFKFSKIYKSMVLVTAQFIEGVRLPQMFRSPAEINMSAETALRIEETVQGHLDWLTSIGYPIGVEVTEDEPVLGLLDGKFDRNWLVAGSNWRIFAPQLKLYAQPEFRKFQVLVDEYRNSLSFANHDNQLKSISRYFADPSVDFPLDDEALEVIWDVVKDIFANSQITPAWYIYKQWNKKFNVGVFTVEDKRTRHGGFIKMKRRSWIQRITPKGVVEAFNNFVKYGLVFDTYQQFFTKREDLKPSKWMNDVVRTPVAAALPEYVAQMVLSAWPNKRFLFDKTPIKLGMPIRATTFETIWNAHSRFKKHYAGDCTAFDSTIVGQVIVLVKSIRKKGFENHRDFPAICKVIDRIYDSIEHGRLVSANTGNVYLKGTGLSTGHASTSTDNSLVMTSLYLVAWKALTGRSAKEFKYYNELSCYGDDHLLSIADDAPAVWTWNNIVGLMATWGVQMREEVPSNGYGVPLERLMFLRKVPRKCDGVFLEEFLEEFPNERPPNWVTLHDPKPLLGKAITSLTTNDPLYRAKRLQSFMYLCAHNRTTYDYFHKALEANFTRYPKVREQVGKYTPSYGKVLRVWYKSELPRDIVELDSDMDVEFDVNGRSPIVLYGSYGLLEQTLNLISKIPDIVTPALRNIGPINFIMKRFGSLLSWPKALIGFTNGCRNKGHLESLVSNSSYDWLSKDVPSTTYAGYSTLLVRHWLYHLLCDLKPRSFSFYIQGWFSLLISGNFLINGFVAPTRPKFTLSYRNLALVVLLNWINLPDFQIFEYLKLIKMPDFIGYLDDAFNSFFNYIWYVMFPTSFNDVYLAVNNSLWAGTKQTIISAPTGSGKSTSMVYQVYLSQCSMSINEKQVIVLVPRVILATGVSKYLQSQFPVIVGYATGDETKDLDASIVYMTYGYFIASCSRWFNRGNLFIFDEFHLDETDAYVLNELLSSTSETVLYASATPKPLNLPVVEIVVNRSFTYDTTTLKMGNVDVFNGYLALILQIDRGVNKWMKHLIFVDTRNELDFLKANLPGVVGVISSWENRLTSQDQFILATSTADVGVTIPDVDIVVTKTFRYVMGPEGLAYYKLPPELITQRSGRTGRTNNGYVYLCAPNEATVVHKQTSLVKSIDVFKQFVKLDLKAPKELLKKLTLNNWYVTHELQSLGKMFMDTAISYANDSYTGTLMKFIHDGFIDSYKIDKSEEFVALMCSFIDCVREGTPPEPYDEVYRHKGSKGQMSFYFWGLPWHNVFSETFHKKLVKEVSKQEPSAFFEEAKLRQRFNFM